MKSNKTVRTLVLAALVLVAIGVVGYAVGGSGGGSDRLLMGTSGNGGFGEDGMTSGGVRPTEPWLGQGTAESDAKGPLMDRAEPPGLAPAPGAMPNVGPGGGTLNVSIDRKIVHTASLQLQVDEVNASFEEVGRIASSVGGFVASSNFSYQGDRQTASVTIRVPAGSYQSVLSELRRLGVRVDAENSSANDVSEEYSDLSARLRNLEATETQLLTLLNRAETISDILTVQDRLNSVRSEIEMIKGRMQLLDNLTDMATITVHLRATGDGPRNNGTGVDLGQTIRDAWADSLEFLGSIAEGVLTVVVFAWWVPIIAVPVVLLWVVVFRNRPRPIQTVD